MAIDGDITKPSVSIHYGLTVAIFLLMLGIVLFVVAWIWGKAQGLAKDKAGVTIPNLPIVSGASGNPMIPVQ